VDGKAVFAAINAAGDYSVWASDGTSAGTVEIFDGGVADGPTRPILGVSAWGNKVVIVSGYGVYVTDTAGTSIQDINPWPQYGSAPGAYVTLGNKMILASPSVNFNGVNEPSMLYVSDGTARNTSVLNVPALQSANGDFTVVGSQVVFTGTDTSGKEAFFVTDGTAAGSHELSLPAGVTLDPAGTDLPLVEAFPNTSPTPPAGIVTLGGGNQTYHAAAGDTVYAGSGNDTVIAAAGGVTVTGSSGRLSFYGGVAASSVTGGTGSTTLLGGAGGEPMSAAAAATTS
jgi:hypothetical protein